MSPASLRPRRILAAATSLLLFAALFGRTLARLPLVQNWDMLGYMALALEWTQSDDLAIHRATYAAAQAELAPETFADLVASGVRRERYLDPAAFHEHLPFYRARVLYTGLVALVHAAGAPLLAATHQVVLGSCALLAGLVLLWSCRRLGAPGGAAFALGLAHLPPLLNLATWATADALATLFTLAALYLALERRAFGATLLALLLAILTRPDSVILAGLGGVALFLLPRDERPGARAILAGLVLCGLAYVGVQRHAREYGWWPLIQISFVEKAVHPAALPTAMDPALYADVLARQLADIPGDGYFRTEENVTGSTLIFPWTGLALAGLALAWRARELWADPRRARLALSVLGVLLFSLPLRWLLFPQLFDRMLAILYVAVPLVLLTLLDAARARGNPGESRG